MTEEFKEPTELEAAKERATNMGIPCGNIKSVDKIEALIQAKIDFVNTPAVPKKSAIAQVRAKAMRLVRIKLAPMSPAERQVPNARVDVGNAVIGTIHRIIPFDVEWHVEQIILDELLQRKFRSKVERRDPVTGRKTYTNVFHKSYAVALLDDLTKVELAALAASQQARGSIDQE